MINEEELKKLEEKIFNIIQRAHIFVRDPKETTEKIMKALKENK